MRAVLVGCGRDHQELERTVTRFQAAVAGGDGEQSELQAVGSFAVAAVYLRQRGSPESKPVRAEHADTAETG